MPLIAQCNAKTYTATAIEHVHEFALPFESRPFSCLLWDHQGGSTAPDRSVLARLLLEGGCRYAVCAGQDCEAWHDAIDLEFVTAHVDDPEHVVDAVHVMTTWHQGEAPDDVAFFFVMCTNFETHDFGQYLVLHLGTSASAADVEAAVRKHVLGESNQQSV